MAVPRPSRQLALPVPPAAGEERRRVDVLSSVQAAFRSHVRLTSVDPAANRFRVDALSRRPALWGDFALVQTWGRLGSPSRDRTTFFPSRPMAQEAIVRLLRRRRHGHRVVAWD